jgi:hypothetical protein
MIAQSYNAPDSHSRPQPEYDLQDLKSRLDGRDLYQSMVGTGNLAEALGRDPEQLGGEESPKYLNLADGNQAGALYNADALQPGQALLMVEGEFDVLIARHIAGDLITVVTVGSASYALGQRWRDRVYACGRVLSALDNDEAGQPGTARLAELLGSKQRAVGFASKEARRCHAPSMMGSRLRWGDRSGIS